MSVLSAGARAGCGNPAGLLPEARMSSASEPQVPSEATPPPPGSTSERPKKKKAKVKAPPPPPPSEDEIDSPTRQTLGMLGVICIMTLCMWIFARGGCNYHPPKESRDPRKVELVELARDPKDAAMEFELRFATKSFGGAQELAKGPMLDLIKEQQKACDADPGCSQVASTLRSTVQVSGQLLERDAQRAVSRITTVGLGPSPQRFIVKVEREGQIWKTVSREVDDGSFKPRPSSAPISTPRGDGSMLLRQPGMPGQATPAGSASP